MIFQIMCGCVGGCVGASLWLASLESGQMSNIIFRQNDVGEKIFSPQNILLYIIAPFQYSFFWSPQFLKHNWIIMTACGTLCGLSLGISGKIIATQIGYTLTV